MRYRLAFNMFVSVGNKLWSENITCTFFCVWPRWSYSSPLPRKTSSISAPETACMIGSENNQSSLRRSPAAPASLSAEYHTDSVRVPPSASALTGCLFTWNYRPLQSRKEQIRKHFQACFSSLKLGFSSQPSWPEVHSANQYEQSGAYSCSTSSLLETDRCRSRMLSTPKGPYIFRVGNKGGGHISVALCEPGPGRQLQTVCLANGQLTKITLWDKGRFVRFCLWQGREDTRLRGNIMSCPLCSTGPLCWTLLNIAAQQKLGYHYRELTWFIASSL